VFDAEDGGVVYLVEVPQTDTTFGHDQILRIF
jgi:hypothetical protein